VREKAGAAAAAAAHAACVDSPPFAAAAAAAASSRFIPHASKHSAEAVAAPERARPPLSKLSTNPAEQDVSRTKGAAPAHRHAIPGRTHLHVTPKRWELPPSGAASPTWDLFRAAARQLLLS